VDTQPPWRLAKVDLDDPDQRRLVRLGRDALQARGVGHSDFDDADVRIGGDLVYLPCGYIGSVGALFVPSRSELIELGSHVGLEDFLWAHHRGVDLAGATKWDRSTTLTVSAVRDADLAVDHLKAILRRPTPAELSETLASLPAVFEGLDLYFAIRALRSLEESGACDFEIGGAGERVGPDVVRFYSATGEYGELSNFARYPIVIRGQRWKTVEHYFQAQKFEDPKDREAVRAAKTAMLAARLGRDRRRKLRRDWESAKVAVMREAVAAKFRQHEALGAMLLATGTAKLVEHTENDSYWGDGGDGTGKNMLGQILMDLRAELARE